MGHHYSGTRYLFEAISFLGRTITVQSENPNDPDIVDSTVIDALNMGIVVTFNGMEDENSIISGFTITGGTVGIMGNGASPTIRKCVITENSSHGIQNTEGSIEDCTISYNSYGIYNPLGAITGCLISNNGNDGIRTGHPILVQGSRISENSGRGIYIANVPVEIVGCEISNNGDWAIQGSGSIGITVRQSRIIDGYGGLHSVGGIVENSIIARNDNHGFYNSSADVLSCTITGNGGWGFSSHTGEISHSIIWNNEAGELNGSTTPVWSGTFNPLFQSVSNYHLASDSACIGIGDPDYPDDPSNPEFDADGNDRVQGEHIDLGAYEFVSDCAGDDFDGDGVPDNCDFDIDDDGVWNTPDVCDFTPVGISVNSEGRPLSDLNLDCLINLADFAIFQNDFGQ